MSHGLDHADADSVVEAANGWYFRRLNDGRVHIVKHRIAGPNAGEPPVAEITLEPQEWHEVVSALGFGESPVVGEIMPAAAPGSPPAEPGPAAEPASAPS